MSTLRVVELLDARRSLEVQSALDLAARTCAAAEATVEVRRRALGSLEARRGPVRVGLADLRAIREGDAFAEALREALDEQGAAFLIACAERDAAVARLRRLQSDLADVEARRDIVRHRSDEGTAMAQRRAEARSDDTSDR